MLTCFQIIQEVHWPNFNCACRTVQVYLAGWCHCLSGRHHCLSGGWSHCLSGQRHSLSEGWCHCLTGWRHCLSGRHHCLSGGWLGSDNKTISVQLNLTRTGTGTELGNFTQTYKVENQGLCYAIRVKKYSVQSVIMKQDRKDNNHDIRNLHKLDINFSLQIVIMNNPYKACANALNFSNSIFCTVNHSVTLSLTQSGGIQIYLTLGTLNTLHWYFPNFWCQLSIFFYAFNTLNAFNLFAKLSSSRLV